MGLKDWRSRRALKDPVRGEFRPSGSYSVQPGRGPGQEMLTGVITAPGIEPTAGQVLNDRRHPHDVALSGEGALPALVDRADPARFIVLWQEVGRPDDQAEARSQAEQAQVTAEGPATAPAVSSLVAAGDDTNDGQAPELAQQLVDEIRNNGISGIGEVLSRALSGYPFATGGPAQAANLTAGLLPAGETARLTASGERATAVLTALADVPVPQAALAALAGPTASLCDLTLEVRRSDGRSYTAQTRLGFRDAERRAAVAVIGQELPVRVDTSDDTQVAVDLAAFDAQHPRP